MNCKICSNEGIKEIYNGFIRAGSFGKVTNETYRVFECTECKVRFLDKFLDPSFYTTDSYRNNYNNSSDKQNYYILHDENNNENICKIGLHNLRDKRVADFGAAAGTFLDVISSVCKQTYAIEPAKFFHEQLSKKHKVFSFGKDFVSSNEKVDVATSFDVIEHLEDPLEFLKEIYAALNDGGKLYLMTPNYNDILNDIAKDEFDKFNYRTAHYFYFCKESITNILKLAGFKNFYINYHHKQDLSNLIYWIKEGKPTGKGKYAFFDSDFNDIYSKYLENNGAASHLWIEAVK